MDPVDYYTILGVTTCAKSTEIRQSYRAALLRVHPDKQSLQKSDSAGVEIWQIQDAYRTLSDPVLRAEHDRLWEEAKGCVKITQVNQRPANEVSLDEFTHGEVVGNEGKVVSRWEHPCRCGGLFAITEDELEAGVHYIGCANCSEVIWVGYEAVDVVSNDGDNKSSDH
jgi:diphthamide biosynthesis protein 4